MRWTRRSRRPLGMELLIVLLPSIGIVLAVYSLLNYRTTRQELMALVNADTERASALIRHATRDGMLLNQLDRVQETLGDIAAHPDVAAVRVYDKAGVVVLSAQDSELGRHIALDSDTCESCHQQDHTAAAASLTRSGLVDLEDGLRVLRHLSVIENEASCSATACHPSPGEQPVLGVLDVEMSIASVQGALAGNQRRTATTTMALFVVVGGVSGLLLRRLVHRPVAELAAGTRRLASGDLHARVDVEGAREFEELGRSLNRMAGEVEAARAELTNWSARLEQKVIEKTEDVQRAHRQALHMEKMASLGKLAATVAHELNNPIGAMLIYARLVERELADQPLDDGVRKEVESHLETLRKECQRCGDIVRTLLSFARRSGAEMGPTDVNDVVDRSLTLVRHHLEISGVTLTRRPLEGDTQIVADSGQIQQALVALLVNAVEAMSSPGCEPRELEVSLDGDADTVRIRIHDTGAGIPPEIQSRIFEPFFSTKEAEAGVGLGLAVVYGIVQRHGGSLQVESARGAGTTFRITLPRRPGAEGTPGTGETVGPVPAERGPEP